MTPLRTTVAVLAVLVGSVAAVSPVAQAFPVAPTAVRLLTPLTPTGSLAAAFRITARFSDANCVSGSPTTGTTYECTTPKSGQGIYETCWVTAQPGYVVCLSAPWARTVTQLHVTRGFDNVDGFTHPARPWGVRLVSGQRCLLDLDATSTSNGHANTYFCTYKTVLVGAIDRSHPVWRARAYRRLAHGRVKWLGWQLIAVAWRPQPSAVDVPATTTA